MPKFSKRSLDNLATCHPDLQKVAHECIKHFDFTVIEGHRNKTQQDKAYATGKSKAKWPTSKHNATPSRAFDATPVPLDWDDIASFRTMAQHMKTAAKAVGIAIKWGGDFKGFFDGPHFELA
jgi:peptidoglycan L-alanyl-D-glutamate endopeptidase CwlK